MFPDFTQVNIISISLLKLLTEWHSNEATDNKNLDEVMLTGCNLGGRQILLSC